MYSAKTVERDIAKLHNQLGLALVRYSLADVQQRKEDLAALVADDGTFRRALTADERQFIRNEQALCAIDFSYWLTRYASLLLDQGGLGSFSDPWESQLILLRVIADLEDRMMEALARGESVDGILIFLHKARQLWRNCPWSRYKCARHDRPQAYKGDGCLRRRRQSTGAIRP